MKIYKNDTFQYTSCDEYKLMVSKIYKSPHACKKRTWEQIFNHCKIPYTFGSMMIKDNPKIRRENKKYNYYIDENNDHFVILSKKSDSILKYIRNYKNWSKVKYILLYEFDGVCYNLSSKIVIK